MASTLADLYKGLAEDPIRSKLGFSDDMFEASTLMLKAVSDSDRASILSNWLERYQPCLFGRVAARKGLITYCFLAEEDLLQSDEYIQEKIQRARTHWTRLAFEGKRSGFVLLAMSQVLLNAAPDATLLAFTRRLASLFLLRDIESDQIILDEIFLEMPGPSRATWRWNVGINYFGASGDRRWWQDHRIPAGLGFSTNSVGHLVKSGNIAEKMKELHSLLDVDDEEMVSTKISSLPLALEWAMRTINNASMGPSGKATSLNTLRAAEASEVSSRCPIKLPPFLQDKDYREYRGDYHTDITIPSEYFTLDIERPGNIQSHRLDFTYLFDPNVENPDFLTTATGRRVRGVQEEIHQQSLKSKKATAEAISLEACPHLSRLLNSPAD